MLILGGLFVLMIIGLVGLAISTGWEDTLNGLMKLTLAQGLILLALSLVNYVLRGLRWHMFARRLGLPTGLMQDLRHFVGGFAMSATPGRVGELVRMRWLDRETGWSFERTAPLVLVDRAADLVAMALILTVSILLSSGMIAGAIPVILISFGAAFVATRPSLLRGLATLGHRTTGRFARTFARLRSASRSLDVFSHPGVLLAAAVLGIIGWLAEGYAFHLLLGWLGADIGLWMAIATFVFATIAGSLTGLPGGIGGAEATMIAILSLEGVPLEISIPVTLIIRLTTLWFAIVLGLIIFPFAERSSLRASHAQ